MSRDRRDAKVVRNVDGLHHLINYLKPLRCDADVYINQKIDVTELIKYVDKKRKEYPDEKITYFHAFVTAIIKTVYNRPYLNRFVVNKRYYDRNDISVSFVAKGDFSDDSKEYMTTVIGRDHDNFDSIRRDIIDRVSKLRNHTGGSTDDAINIVGKLPRPIRSLVMAAFLCMDRHDILPKSICTDNIYYSSVIISNLGSIGCGAIYHNLTNFGTNSILIATGDIHKEKIINKKGKEEIRDICEFGITLDERIADGFYFAKSVQMLQYILENPELLDDDVSKKVDFKNEKQ